LRASRAVLKKVGFVIRVVVHCTITGRRARRDPNRTDKRQVKIY
jgi:hypothetical protein